MLLVMLSCHPWHFALPLCWPTLAEGDDDDDVDDVILCFATGSLCWPTLGKGDGKSTDCSN